MGLRHLAFGAGVCLVHAACSGSEFEAGSAGAAGSAGVSAGGGAGAGNGGSAGQGGGAGAGSGGSAPDAGVGGAGGVAPLAVVRASETVLSDDEVPTLTLDPTPQAGNAIIVGVTCISDYEGDCIIGASGVSDSHGNAYTRVVQGEPITSSQQAARGYIFIAENISIASGPFVISVDPDGDSMALQNMAWGVIEVSGLAAPPSNDAWGASPVSPADAQATTATTNYPTTDDNQLAVGVFSMRSNDNFLAITPEPTWTQHHIHQNNASGPPGHSLVTRLIGPAGTVSHTWTHDVPTRAAAGIIATFRGAAD